jgi:hypothetical protein
MLVGTDWMVVFEGSSTMLSHVTVVGNSIHANHHSSSFGIDGGS